MDLPFTRFLFKKSKNYSKFIKKNHSEFEKKDHNFAKKPKKNKKLPILLKFYLFFYIFITLLAYMFLIILSQISEYRLELVSFLLIGTILNLPQITHHLNLLKKNKQKIHNYPQKLKKLLLNTPLIILISCSLIFIPYVTYELPFFPETK